MTELFIQNGGVFLPAGVTLEEIKELEKEVTELRNRSSNWITDLNELKIELNELKFQIENERWQRKRCDLQRFKK